jgi:hypothetical protein
VFVITIFHAYGVFDVIDIGGCVHVTDNIFPDLMACLSFFGIAGNVSLVSSIGSDNCGQNPPSGPFHSENGLATGMHAALIHIHFVQF